MLRTRRVHAYRSRRAALLCETTVVARLWTTVVVELPSGHSKGGGFSSAALEGSAALPSGNRPQNRAKGADPRTGNLKMAESVSVLACLCRGFPGSGSLVLRPLPLRVPVWLLSSSCFFPLAAGVTFQLPAGGTSGQTQGHGPKNRSFQVSLLTQYVFNLDFAYGAASVLTDRGCVCRGGERSR